MKKILTLLLLLPLLSIAQVGVNTTAPKAALDVESTNNGMLIPRVQLTSTLDATTVVNPNAGPLETSTLVYNIAPAGVVPNNVVAGFYYWNGSQWTAIAGNEPSDHDWYEVGTTVAPNAITDNMFNLGKVAIGSATPAATAVLQVELGASTTDGILFNGANNGAGTVPNLGAGTRMMFFPGKNAFRAGSVSGTQWDNSNVGANSAAMGRNNTASGYGSFAMGEGSIASGTNTVAMGNSATATGENSVAMGNSTANASYATALNTSTANEENATSMGIATANGYGSLATGFSTTFGNYAISGGVGSVASGNNSVATGDSSIASGQNAVAMGRFASATAAHSAAFGSASATGQYAAAFNNSVANGQNTIAMVESTANGDSSVSTGFSTANGAYSFSGGFGTTAQSIGETTLGVFNRLYTMSPSGATTLDGNDHLFNLGNGTSAIATHNALTVFKDGRLNINEAYTLPNTDGTANQVLQTNGTGTLSWQNPTPSGFTHYLGELYLGGIIFELYKGSDGLEHGLIVSLTQANQAWQTIQSLTNANRTEDGVYNTSLMINSPAVTYAASLGAGWYIPSVDELNLLYNNRYYVNKALRAGGYTLFSGTGLYWSSNESAINAAYAFFGFNGSFGSQDKTDITTVRAIRSF